MLRQTPPGCLAAAFQVPPPANAAADGDPVAPKAAGKQTDGNGNQDPLSMTHHSRRVWVAKRPTHAATGASTSATAATLGAQTLEAAAAVAGTFPALPAAAGTVVADDPNPHLPSAQQRQQLVSPTVPTLNRFGLLEDAPEEILALPPVPGPPTYAAAAAAAAATATAEGSQGNHGPITPQVKTFSRRTDKHSSENKGNNTSGDRRHNTKAASSSSSSSQQPHSSDIGGSKPADKPVEKGNSGNSTNNAANVTANDAAPVAAAEHRLVIYNPTADAGNNADAHAGDKRDLSPDRTPDAEDQLTQGGKRQMQTRPPDSAAAASTDPATADAATAWQQWQTSHLSTEVQPMEDCTASPVN